MTLCILRQRGDDNMTMHSSMFLLSTCRIIQLNRLGVLTKSFFFRVLYFRYTDTKSDFTPRYTAVVPSAPFQKFSHLAINYNSFSRVCLCALLLLNFPWLVTHIYQLLFLNHQSRNYFIFFRFYKMPKFYICQFADRTILKLYKNRD